jgi:hypothetical protein
MKIDLSGKTAIVTGSTGGIGFAIARGLADCGATVVVSWNSTIGSRNQRMGGIVQLRGLFAARETQVLAQSFSTQFPFPIRFVEQLAYGKDLKGGGWFRTTTGTTVFRSDGKGPAPSFAMI